MNRRLDLEESVLKRFCERHRIRRLSLFGSTLKGTARPDSDVDLLVEFEPGSRRLIPADVVVMSADAFERQKTVINTLAWRAAREGQVHEFAA